MKRKVSMADVAQRCGVSASTVSRAIRNDPRISAQVKVDVEKVCTELGYRPNPLVSALMLNRRSPNEESGLTTIALITDYGGEGWRKKDVCRWEYEGIQKRADELGFQVEEFSVADYGGSIESLEKVLRARGIRAVLLGFSRDKSRKKMLGTTDFVVAGLSSYFREAEVDRVNFNGLYNVRLALNEMRRLGCRKTGLVVPEFNNRISGYQWSAGALETQRNMSPEERCPPFIADGDQCEDSFRRWMKAEKPDSLVVYKFPIKSWLARMGLRIPDDIRVAYLYRSEEEMKNYAGIDGNLQMVGSAAVSLLAEGLGTNRTGLPEYPRDVLIRGYWRAGASASVKGKSPKI